MIKTQVYLTKDEFSGLKSLAARTGKKQSELIREAIDNLLVSREEKDWKAVLCDLRGIWKNREDTPDFDEIRKEADHNL